MDSTETVSSHAPQMIDPRAYRSALGCFPTGVAIVTSNDEAGMPVGVTCNSFSSVSLDPPLVLWSLRTKSKSRQAYSTARGFAIHILSEHQSELSNRFASSIIADKFENVEHRTNQHGVPLLSDCVAVFECKTVAQHVEGDHIIFIGQVERFDSGRADDPLVFCKGAYTRLTQSLHDLVNLANIPTGHLYQARRALHDVLVRLACEYGSEEDFDAIEKNLTLMEQFASSGDFNRRTETALEFFNLIAKAGHNEVLRVLNASLTQIISRSLYTDAGFRYRPELMEIRKRILVNLRERDERAVATSMSVYLDYLRSEEWQQGGTADSLRQ